MQFGQEDGELVAPHAGQRVGPADAAFEPAGDLLEQRIADGMTERVVDLLEPVEIHEEHRGQPSLPARLGQRAVQAVPERGPVGKARQSVVLRLVGQFVRQLPLFDRDGGQLAALCDQAEFFRRRLPPHAAGHREGPQGGSGGRENRDRPA